MPDQSWEPDALLQAISALRDEFDHLIDAELARLSDPTARLDGLLPATGDLPRRHVDSEDQTVAWQLVADEPRNAPRHPTSPPSRPPLSPTAEPNQDGSQEASGDDSARRLDALAQRLQGRLRRAREKTVEPHRRIE